MEDYLTPLEQAAHEVYLNAAKTQKAAFDAYLKDISNAKLNAAWGQAIKDEDAKRKNWTGLLNRQVFLHSSYFFFAELPEPIQITKTDADGKFSFKIPSGSYALVAQSSRKAGERTEFYHWIIKVKVDTDKKVMLANDNLADSGSADSLISAAGTVETIFHEGEMIRFDTVLAFVENDKRARAAGEAARQEAERQTQLSQAAKKETERQTQLEGFRKDPKAAQQKAIELYPDVGVAGSPLNKEFVERVKRYQTEKKEFFAEPDWPVQLAKECSEALAAKSVLK